ncbi:MAG: hypothetical protein KF833_05300 [Verrucomicrobiae bacterium]|nr:hypothetical protein [Verrucomicrobiae bacterium]
MTHPLSPALIRRATLLAINLLFLMVWGFAGIGKLLGGMPAWFPEKFGGTFLASFPGLPALFWLLVAGELLALGLALAALVTGEFLASRTPRFLSAALAWSLFVFVQLGFGQWLTGEFNGAFQQFVYFAGTLVALQTVLRSPDSLRA